MNDYDGDEMPEESGNPIHIKASHRGKLHRALGIPQRKPIPLSRIASAKRKAKRTGDKSLMEMATFAQNAKTEFHHK